MPARHRHLLLLPILLGLAACGDSPAPGTRAGTSGGTTTGSGLSPRTQAELEEVMTKRLKEGGLTSLPAALGPLKPADVETFLKIHPQARKAGGDPGELAKVLEPHGLTPTQWAVLQGRVVGAAMSLKHGQVPAPIQEDAAVVAPFKDRVLGAIEGS
jgi:hypothetical protein